LIKSNDIRFPAGILALIFMLVLSLSNVSLSDESQAEGAEVLRKASLRWMKLGMQQYQQDLFTDAERSFRRAHVFGKYLAADERGQLEEYLTNARTAMSEGKQAVAETQSAKTEEKLKSSEPSEPNEHSEPMAAEEPQQVVKEPGTTNSQIEQKVPSVKTVESDVPKIQLAAVSSQDDDVIVVKDESFWSKLMRLSALLSQNRGNILLVGLPILAVLIFISKLQARIKRPGRRVYTNHVPANSSFIGSRLNVGRENNRAVKKSKTEHSASSAENPKRKRFTQSTEHWKKNAVQSSADTKTARASEKWPQQKDKFEANNLTLTEDQQKQCGKCKQVKPLSDFHKNKSSRDGLASWCKECKRQYRKNRSAAKKGVN